MTKQELLRSLPQIDEIIQDKRCENLLCACTPQELKNCIRNSVESIRKEILCGALTESNRSDLTERIIEDTLNAVSVRLEETENCGLRKVINGTGIILHTNLGRSLLCDSAVKAIEKTAQCFSNLEYDIETGKRGSRHSHIERIVTQVTGAESAMVVNNNAGATLIALSALAQGKEVITSRGELVEIGGSFRVPEIMEQGGAVLREVGTTNRTRIRDYRKAFREGKTAAMMKVHKSNYKIVGFTEETSIKEISDLAKELGVISIYDLGSGNMVDLSRWGINEPTIPQLVEMGVDLILFSGDKMLGGPQAGIIIGKKKYIDILKQHPLARALRVDKLTIAALVATLSEYKDEKNALKAIPVLRMISVKDEDLKAKAAFIAEKTGNSVVRCKDLVGGGSDPTHELDGWAVKISKTTSEDSSAENSSAADFSAADIERKLRLGKPSIVARIEDGSVLISARTLQDSDVQFVIKALQ